MLCRLGHHQKHRAGPKTSWKPRGYRRREESGRTLGEAAASIVVTRRKRNGEELLCPAGNTWIPDWWKAMGMLLPVAAVCQVAPNISLGIVSFAVP